MKADQVIVRLPYRAGGSVRLGTVLEHDNELYRIRWDDGADEEVYLGDYEHLIARGSLEHDALLDLDQVRKAFESDPVPVFSRALRERAEPVTMKLLKEELVSIGLDPAVVDAAWKANRKSLVSDPHITTAGKGAAIRYAWTDDPETPS